MKRVFLKFGVVLSLFAAVSVFAHLGSDHVIGMDKGGHACAVCQVALHSGDVPQVSAIPFDQTSEPLLVAETQLCTSSALFRASSRSPPNL